MAVPRYKEGARTRGPRRGRQLVLLAATDSEAEPLRAGLARRNEFVVATKKVHTGELPAVGAGPPKLGWNRVLFGRRLTIPAVLAIGGCDKANTAHILTCLFEGVCRAPRAVIQVGIAGSFQRVLAEPGARAKKGGPAIGDIVLATQEVYSDTGASSPGGWLSAAELGLPIARVAGSETGGIFPLDLDLVREARAAIMSADWPGRRPAVHMGPCVTSSRATGTQAEARDHAARWGALAESMEGAAAAHMCALYGVPFLEIRAISNFVGDRDRGTWAVEKAVETAGRAALAVVAGLGRKLEALDNGVQATGAGTRDDASGED